MDLAAALRAITLATLAIPAIASPPLDITRIPTHDPAVALTIDAGSSAEGAIEILDILRANGIRSTLFLTGEFIEKHPEIVLRIVEDGHEVGNHTWSHPHLTTWSSRRSHATAPGVNEVMFVSELARTAEAFEKLTGSRMAPLWRAPYGEQNRVILEWAAAAGWRHVGWTRGSRTSLDTLDWVANRRARNYLAPAAIVRRVLDFETVNDVPLDGSIILMHLGSARPPEERFATMLPEMIDELAQRGFRFVTVGQMLATSEVEESGR